MKSFPAEIQLNIIEQSRNKHICLFVCKLWNQLIRDNPSTTSLLCDVMNSDIYNIRYKCNKTWHLSVKEFYFAKVVDKVIEINNDKITKIFLDVYYSQYLNINDNGVVSKLISSIITNNNGKIVLYIRDKRYLEYCNGAAVDWNRSLMRDYWRFITS